MATRWSPESWRSMPIEQVPVYPDGPKLDEVEAAACDLPAARLCRRGAGLEGEARPRRRRRGLSAAGRRLRRELCRASRRRDPRFLPRVPADGGRADLCRRLAGGEARPHRRTVRQAALRATETQDGAELPSYRGDIINGIDFTEAARVAGPAAHADGLSAVGGDAQSAARLRARRLRQSRSRASVESRLRQGQPGRAIATRSSPTASPRACASCAPAA